MLRLYRYFFSIFFFFFLFSICFYLSFCGHSNTPIYACICNNATFVSLRRSFWTVHGPEARQSFLTRKAVQASNLLRFTFLSAFNFSLDNRGSLTNNADTSGNTNQDWY